MLADFHRIEITRAELSNHGKSHSDRKCVIILQRYEMLQQLMVTALQTLVFLNTQRSL